MRAREPDQSGYADNRGIRLYYEVFGSGAHTLLFLPTWSLVHSRIWKMQVPYLARHCRVVTFDGRGNGKSDRPTDPASYAYRTLAEDALAVMDATRTARATMVGYSMGGATLAVLAVNHPERIEGAVFIAPVAPFGTPLPERLQYDWHSTPETIEGWAKHTRGYWLTDYVDWLAFFAGKLANDPHSTKLIEDIIEWGSETTPHVLIATYEARQSPTEPPWDRGELSRAYYARIRCPVLVIHGTNDAIVAHSAGAGVAAATGGKLISIVGGGHAPHARHPVRVNILLREFVEAVAAQHEGGLVGRFHGHSSQVIS